MTIKPRRWKYKASGGMLFAEGEIESTNVVVAMEELLTELRAKLQPPYTLDMLTKIEINEVKPG